MYMCSVFMAYLKYDEVLIDAWLGIYCIPFGYSLNITYQKLYFIQACRLSTTPLGLKKHEPEKVRVDIKADQAARYRVWRLYSYGYDYRSWEASRIHGPGANVASV